MPPVPTDVMFERLPDGKASIAVTVVDADKLSAIEFAGTSDDMTVSERSTSPLLLARAKAMSAAREGNRWAAFTDDELDTLEGELPRTDNLKPFLAEITAELERRA